MQRKLLYWPWFSRITEDMWSNHQSSINGCQRHQRLTRQALQTLRRSYFCTKIFIRLKEFSFDKIWLEMKANFPLFKQMLNTVAGGRGRLYRRHETRCACRIQLNVFCPNEWKLARNKSGEACEHSPRLRKWLHQVGKLVIKFQPQSRRLAEGAFKVK